MANSINNIVKKLNENRLDESSVGAFYMIGSNLLANSVDLSDGEDYGGFINYSSHWDLWKLLSRTYPQLKNYEYDDFPRGRVVFDKNKRKFIIFIDKKLDNPEKIDKILKEFGIGTNYEINTEDEHYDSLRTGNNLHLHEDVIVRGPLEDLVDCDVKYRKEEKDEK